MGAPLPRIPIFAGYSVFGQVKENRIGDDRIIRTGPLPRAPIFICVFGQVKYHMIGSYIFRPASNLRLLTAIGGQGIYILTELPQFYQGYLR